MLNHIKMMATDISASNCMYNWTRGVATSGTFECATGMETVIPIGANGIPIGWATMN